MRALFGLRRAACVTVAIAAGLLAAPATAPAAVSCQYLSGTLFVQLTASSDLAQVSLSGANIVVRDVFTPMLACTGTAPTVTNTDTVSIFSNGAHSFNSVVIEDAGSYGPGATAEPTGATSEIEFVVNLNGGEGAHLSVRQTGGAIRFGADGINPNATGAEVSPDVDIFPQGAMSLESRAGTSASTTPGTLGAQGGAGTGEPLGQAIELLGNNGADKLTGGDGDDKIEAFAGGDTLAGGAADDTIQPGAGDDSTDGGPGSDTVDYSEFGVPSIAVDLGLAGQQNTGGSGNDSFPNVENVIGTGGADVLRGNGAANKLTSFGGSDILEGRGANDTLAAGAGNDTLDVRDGGPDTADCGADSDSVTADIRGVDALTGCENASFLPTPATCGGGGGAVLSFGEKTHVSLKLAAGRIPARGPLKIRVANANGFAITGKLSGQTTKKVSVARKRRVKLKAKSFRVGAHEKKTVSLRLPKALRTLLKRRHKLALSLTAKVKDPPGHTRTVRKTVKPKLKRKKQH